MTHRRWRKGSFNLLAARPSMGTQLGLKFASAAAIGGARCYSPHWR